MCASAESPSFASRRRWRRALYWLATTAVAGELGLGGIWDIMRMPAVRELVLHLGYPSY